MTEKQAKEFAEFIKDHDRRLETRARPDGDSSTIFLTLASGGTMLEPISEVAEYKEMQMNENDPGLTVKAAGTNGKHNTMDTKDAR